MLPSEREHFIVDFLRQHGLVTVSQICSHCNCSPQTARRDLTRLADEGLLKRTHGGAVSLVASTPTVLRSNGKSLLEARLALVDRADALIVTPVETTGTRLLVERARRAGVPIISEAIAVSGATTTVSINDYQAGLELGRWVACYARSHLGGKVVALDITVSLPNTNARSRGFADGLNELSSENREVFSIDGQGLYHIVQPLVTDALAVHPEVNVIFGINDDSTRGALDAYRAAGLDDTNLLVVGFGCEGDAVKNLLAQGSPLKASIAMFPELVGRVCVDAAECAYHGCSLPEKLFTPFTIITPENLEQFYTRDDVSGQWIINTLQVNQLLKSSPAIAMLNQCGRAPKPLRLGWIQVYSSHDWYQIIERSIREHARDLGISIEIVDASQDMTREADDLKKVIGQTAAEYLSDGDTIIVDAGVTTKYLASAIRGREGITVITNSLWVLAELEGQEGITLVSSGGVVRHKSRSLIGPGAEAAFQELRADKAFIAVGGLSLDFGLSNTNIAEATVKRLMMKAAREVIVLADYTKIGVESLVKIAPLDSVNTLITDVGISAHDRTELLKKGIDVVVAG